MALLSRLIGKPATNASANGRESIKNFTTRWIQSRTNRNIASSSISYRNNRHATLSPTESLQTLGHCLIPGALSALEVKRLRDSVNRVYQDFPADARDGRPSADNAKMFRYEMINRSEEVRQVTSDRRILDVIDPLLGKNCHLISSTAWRNPADISHAPRGQEWHIDAGPFVPRPADVPWPDAIPYPIFIIAVHVFLDDVSIEDGPTAVLEGSHRSGCKPPKRHKWDIGLQINGYQCAAMIAKAGDIGMFVSDVWHRRLPPQTGGTGRFFLQTNYGRRHIAQRIKPTSDVRQVHHDVVNKALTRRERLVLGEHPQGAYDG